MGGGCVGIKLKHLIEPYSFFANMKCNKINKESYFAMKRMVKKATEALRSLKKCTPKASVVCHLNMLTAGTGFEIL